MSYSQPSSPSKSFSFNTPIDNKARNVSNTYTIIEHDVESQSSPITFSVGSPLSVASGWFIGFTDYSISAMSGDNSILDENRMSPEKDEKLGPSREDKDEDDLSLIRTSRAPVLESLRPISRVVMEKTLSDEIYTSPLKEEYQTSNGSQRSTSTSSDSSSSSISTTSTTSSRFKKHSRSTSSSIHFLLPSHSRLRSSSRILSSSSSILHSSSRAPSTSKSCSNSNLNESSPKSSITSSITRASASCISISTASKLDPEVLKSVSISTQHLYSPSNLKAPFRNPFTSIAEQELRLAHAHILLREEAARRRNGNLRKNGIEKNNQDIKQPRRKRSRSLGGTSSSTPMASSPSIRAFSSKALSSSPSFSEKRISYSSSSTNFNNRHRRSATTSDVSKLGGISSINGFEMRTQTDVGSQSSIVPSLISPRTEVDSFKCRLEENKSKSFFIGKTLSSSPSSIDSTASSYIGSGSSRITSLKSEKLLLRSSHSLSSHLNQKEMKLNGFKQFSESRLPSNVSIRDRRIASSKLKLEREKANRNESIKSSIEESSSQTASQVGSFSSGGKERLQNYGNSSFNQTSPASINTNSSSSATRSSVYSRIGNAYAPKRREFREPLPLSSSSTDLEKLSRSSSVSTGLPRRSNLPPLNPPTSPTDGRGSQENGRDDDEDLALSFGGLLKRSNTVSSGIAGIKTILDSTKPWHSRTASSPTSISFTSSERLSRSRSPKWIDSRGRDLGLKVDVERTSINQRSSFKVSSRETSLPSPISPMEGDHGWENKSRELRLTIDTCETPNKSNRNQRNLYQDAHGGLTPPLTAKSGYQSSEEGSERSERKENGNSVLAVGQYLSSKALSIPTSSSVQSLLSFSFNLSSEDLISSSSSASSSCSISNSENQEDLAKFSKNQYERIGGYLSPPPLPSWIRKRNKSIDKLEVVKPVRITSPSWTDDSISCPINPIPVYLPSSSSFKSSNDLINSKDRSKLKSHPKCDWSIKGNNQNQNQKRERKINKEKREREFSQRNLVALKEHLGEDEDQFEIEIEDQSKKLNMIRNLDHSDSSISISNQNPSSSPSSSSSSASFATTSASASDRKSFREFHQPKRSKTQEELISASNQNHLKQNHSFSGSLTVTSSSSSSSASDVNSTSSKFIPSQHTYRPAFRSNAKILENEDQMSLNWEDELCSF